MKKKLFQHVIHNLFFGRKEGFLCASRDTPLRWGQRYNHGTPFQKNSQIRSSSRSRHQLQHDYSFQQPYNKKFSKISPLDKPSSTHTFVEPPASCKLHPPKRSITGFTPFFGFGTAEADFNPSRPSEVRRLDHQKKLLRKLKHSVLC